MLNHGNRRAHFFPEVLPRSWGSTQVTGTCPPSPTNTPETAHLPQWAWVIGHTSLPQTCFPRELSQASVLIFSSKYRVCTTSLFLPIPRETWSLFLCVLLLCVCAGLRAQARLPGEGQARRSMVKEHLSCCCIYVLAELSWIWGLQETKAASDEIRY